MRLPYEIHPNIYYGSEYKHNINEGIVKDESYTHSAIYCFNIVNFRLIISAIDYIRKKNSTKNTNHSSINTMPFYYLIVPERAA